VDSIENAVPSTNDIRFNTSGFIKYLKPKVLNRKSIVLGTVVSCYCSL